MFVMLVTKKQHMTCNFGSRRLIFQSRVADWIVEALSAGKIRAILIGSSGEPIEVTYALREDFPVSRIPIAVLPQFPNEFPGAASPRSFPLDIENLVSASPQCTA